MNPETATEIAIPELNAELWGHQAAAFRRYHDQPAAFLGHDMGTGKGATAIALLEHDQATRVLVLCPRSVIGIWPAQLNGPLDPPGPKDGFSPRTWEVWSGRVMGARGPKKNPSVDERAAALVRANTDAIKLDKPFVAVVNYEAAWQGDMAALLVGTDWDAVICDESHRLKKPSGKASRLAAKIADRVRGRGGRVINATGTPMPHTPLDVWAQFRILDGGYRLGTNYNAFCRHFAEAEEIYVAGGKKRVVYNGIRESRQREFTNVVGQLLDIVKAEDVQDLPEDFERDLLCDLSPAASRAYADLERHGIHEAEGGTLTAANAMVELMRLAQATSGFGTDVDTHNMVELDPGQLPDKAKALSEFLQDVPTREPVVVFCRFRADLDAVRKVCEDQGRAYGELSGRRRDGITAESHMNPEIDVLGAQLKSGGVGIDLTRSRLAIYYSQDFALADYKQSRKRLLRPGQTRPVLFTHILARGTVDHAVYGALASRNEVIEAVVRHLQNGGTP